MKVGKLILLLAGHMLCDYPLQGDFLAKGKNRHTPVPGVPWWHCLTAHAMIQAGMVYLITGSVWFFVAELAIHWITDFGKCEKWFGINVDQSIHIACKIAWAIL